MRPKQRTRRGAIYVAVIGVALLISVIGLGAMAAVRTQRLHTDLGVDTIRARELARSAVELGILAVTRSSTWRTSFNNGVWANNVALGAGSMKIEGLDLKDANLANRPTDPLVLRGTGTSGRAVQLLEVDLQASGEPIDALKYAVFTAGQLHVESGDTLTLTGGAGFVNGSLRNDGTIVGDVQCVAFTAKGTVTGTFSSPVLPKSMPDPGVLTLYRNLGTQITPPNTMQNVLLSPSSNPYGTPDPDGVYVIVTSSDLTIRNVRVLGTLVIVNGTKRVTLEGGINMQPARPDYPVLLVQGDIRIDFSRDTILAESSTGANFNPSGSAYKGVENATTSDSYPSEVQGLVHAGARIEIRSNPKVMGTLIAESSGSDSINVDGTPEIVYDAGTLTTPIMGYMKSVEMKIVPGSWRQVVLP